MLQYSLFNFDAPQLRDSSRNDIRNGDAAEAFALAKLLKWGFDAHDERSLSPVDFSSMLSCARPVHRNSRRLLTGRHQPVPCFYIRFKEGDHVLRHEVEFPDFEAAQTGAREGAKHLLLDCIRTGRDPTPEAVIIVDSNGSEVKN